MDFNGIRRLYLPLRPKARYFAGTKDSRPSVSAPSAGLRPLIVSRVKCGGRTLSRPLSATVYGKYDMPSMRLFKKSRKILISACRKHVVAATRPSPFKVGDNQRPERTMSGVRKPSPESSVPGETLTGGRRRNQFCRGYGSPSVLNEVSHEFSTAMRFEKCKRSP